MHHATVYRAYKGVYPKHPKLRAPQMLDDHDPDLFRQPWKLDELLRSCSVSLATVPEPR